MLKERVAIIVSGGPAPGINSLIASFTIEANNHNKQVFGVRAGFEGLVNEGEACLQELLIADVSRIPESGGSIIGTSRFNPFKEKSGEEKLIATLRAARISKLAIIGGDGSAYLSYQLSSRYPEFKVVHLPKTIDNDLPLPHYAQSFGFETARSVGSEILSTLNLDARTEGKRWFLVTTMGRRCGALALGMGLAAGTTLTIIPEEFQGAVPKLSDLADIIWGAMRRRIQEGKRYGVVVLAEGLIDLIDPASCDALINSARDDLGRVIYSDLEIGELLSPLVRERCKGEKVRVITKNLGYELRCHAPTAFDIETTKFLGVGALRALDQGRTGIIVYRHQDMIESIPLSDLLDSSGKVKTRNVDISSDLYRVARSLMVR